MREFFAGLVCTQTRKNEKKLNYLLEEQGLKYVRDQKNQTPFYFHMSLLWFHEE